MIIKPLTMLVAASAIATLTSKRTKSFFGSESTMSPATIETEEIAFVSAMSGVCKSRETCRMSLDTEEGREDENEQVDRQVCLCCIGCQFYGPPFASAFFVGSCTTSPAFITSGPLIRSSFMSIAIAPCLKIADTNDVTLRA